MKDERLYGRFTLTYPSHPKIAPLSDAAFRAHVTMILWSREQRTDGRIPGRMAKILARPKVLQELCTNDENAPSLKKVGDDYWLHDFDLHQETNAQIEANRANGRAGGLAKSRNRAARVASESLPPLDEQATPPSDNSYHPSSHTDTDTDTRKELVHPAAEQAPLIEVPEEPKSPYSAAFETWWKHYPRKQSKGDAFKAWETWRKRKQLPQLDVLVAAADGYSRKMRDTDPQFIKLPGGWLRDRKWEDEDGSAVAPDPQRVQQDAAREAWLKARGVTLEEYERRKTETGWLDSLQKIG